MDTASDPIEFDRRKSKGTAILELYLFAANCETTIAEYLLSNGILIDPRTRLLLANIRDQSGVISRKIKCELKELAFAKS